MTRFYIKYAATNVPVAPAGAVRPAPPGSQPWLSPSSWAEGPGGTMLNQVTEDEEAQLRVRVDTAELGAPQLPPEDVAVQLWVSDYTLGVGPAGFHAGMSIPPAGLEDPALDALPPSARLAKIPWTPLAGDFFNVDANGNAHMCIGANAFIDGVDGARMPPPDNVDIWNEPHHAQLNISILDAGDGIARVRMVAHNPDPEEAGLFVLAAERVRGRLGPIDREHLLAVPHVRRIGGEKFDPRKFKRRDEPLERIELRHGGTLVVGRDKTPLHRSKRGLERIALEGPRGGGEQKLELELPPHDPEAKPTIVETHLRLADPEDWGGVEAVDVVQRRHDGELIGGARVVVLAARPRDVKAG